MIYKLVQILASGRYKKKVFYEASLKIFQIKKSGHINKQTDIKISPAVPLNICKILTVQCR